MSDADDDATKEADNEVQIPNTAASAKKSAHAKHKAKAILSLQKSPRSSSSSISSKGETRGRKTRQNYAVNYRRAQIQGRVRVGGKENRDARARADNEYGEA